MFWQFNILFLREPSHWSHLPAIPLFSLLASIYQAGVAACSDIIGIWLEQVYKTCILVLRAQVLGRGS